MNKNREKFKGIKTTNLGINAADISSNLAESHSLKFGAGPIYEKHEKGKCIKISFLYTIAEGKYKGTSILIDCPTQNITWE